MKKVLSILLMMVFVLSSCGQQTKNPAEVEPTENEIRITGLDGDDNYGDLYEEGEEREEKSYGSFGFGVDLEAEGVKEDENGMITFTYEDVTKIPYHVENVDETVKAQFGLIAFTDGIAQPFWIEDAQGNKIEEETYMHTFDLEVNDRQKFYIAFHPVAGKKGDMVGFITASILNPNFAPEDEKCNYGVYYEMSATVPQQIAITKDVDCTYKGKVCGENVDIPDDLIGEIESSLAGETLEEHLESTFVCKIEAADKKDYIEVQDDKAKLNFSCFGGPEVLDRLTIFVNNKPVKVNGADYIEFKMETGKMTTVELEVDMSGVDCPDLSTIYGVVMTAGNDYMVSDIASTKPLVLKK